MPFIIHQVIAIISTGKCLRLAPVLVMLFEPCNKVVGSANIQGSFVPVGKDVHPKIVLLFRSGHCRNLILTGVNKSAMRRNSIAYYSFSSAMRRMKKGVPGGVWGCESGTGTLSQN